MRRLLLWPTFMLLALLAGPGHTRSAAPVVLAASSLQESMNAAADAWTRAGHARPRLSFAASSALARQAEAGAPADLFVSADEAWMDRLAAAGRLAPGSRATLVGNRLVVIQRRGGRDVLTSASLAARLSGGPLAMADPAAVPAGRYAKAALQHMRAWDRVAPRIVRAENVRAALALVERGAAPFGIVYLTDARASAKVRIAGMFPSASHPPIRYPIARLRRSTSADAEGFRRFLLSWAGQAIFARFGFSPP